MAESQPDPITIGDGVDATVKKYLTLFGHDQEKVFQLFRRLKVEQLRNVAQSCNLGYQLVKRYSRSEGAL